jgi:pimeloyl-ACP methyl ester carboxylesterase
VEFDMDGLETCAKSWPHDPKNFTTEAAARDLEELRKALGAPQLNLLGGSYGTRLALVYARLYEARVRTMVLDGVAPPTMALPSSFAEDGQAALDTLFDDCREAPGCAARFPELRSIFRGALRQSGEQQAPVAFVHPRTGESIEVPLTERVFASGVRGLLYSPELSALLPMIIAAAAQGDFVPFLNALVALGDAPEPMMDLGLMLSVLCAEDLPRIDPAAYTDRWSQTFLESSMYDLFASGCDRWPVEAVPASATAAVEVSTPTLLLSGALDPVTPARWAEEAAKTLQASTHLVIEGSGHGTLSKPCVTKIAAEFIETREVSDESKECLAGLRRPPFFIDAKGPAH